MTLPATNERTFPFKTLYMKPFFITVVGTDNKKYRVNVNLILYYYSNERKGNVVTEIVFTNKETVETEETPSELDEKINKQQNNNSSQGQQG